LAAATVILLGVSLSWAIIVDTTPQENRPYIGGSKTNSVLELALGYNGIQRLEGMGARGQGGKTPVQTEILSKSSGTDMCLTCGK
ncbi:MAG: Glycosyl transferase, family 39, partial [Desulfotomaculum sp. 46_80]